MGKTFVVERHTQIKARPEAVYARIIDFHEWVDWSPWEGLDPDMKRTHEGPESGVGSVYSWLGNRKVGQGQMQIMAADAPRKIEIKLSFLKPWKAVNDTVFRLEESGDSTQITWRMTGPKSFVMRVMGLFMNMDKMIGGDFEKGLAKLKAVAEA